MEAHGVPERIVMLALNAYETGKKDITARQNIGKTSSFIKEIMYAPISVKAFFRGADASRIPSTNIHNGVDRLPSV